MPLPHPPNRWRPKPAPKPKKPAGNISVNIPGFTPNWSSILSNDPRYVQKKNTLAGQSAAAKAARNAAMIQKLIAFGGIPDLTAGDSGAFGDFQIDDATRQAILANTNPNTSTTAKLKRQNEANIQALQDMLAARGMLRSGSLGTGLRLEQEDYAGKQTNALTELLGLLAGDQSAFATGEAGREADLSAYGEQITDDLKDSGLYDPREGSTVTAQRDPATGLYRDANGNYYDENGQLVVDPQAARMRQGLFGQASQNRPVQAGRPYVPGYRP